MIPPLIALTTLSACFILLPTSTSAHGNHDQIPLSDDADWATRHMAEEHHIANFDPGAFFSLHDFDSNGAWSPDEIKRTYGLQDESLRGQVTPQKENEVVKSVLGIFDADGDGLVSREEWMGGTRGEGKRLPDFGLGPGHHGDDEYEYEIHHWEKYHDENTREEDLTHPEDIAHFAKHDQEDDAAARQEALDQMPIVESNIPGKFRRY
ncbi:hypothetical protein MMC20_007686 [Loxospora ochrophaea]|nr:hypothetical protein [Loxospora ochrophaea]